MYRFADHEPMLLLVHPGGPFWRNKDRNSWSIPKGEFGEDETAEAAAIREFEEETGFTPRGDFVDLGVVRQASGKIVTVWAFEGDCDPAQLTSNLCKVEWPPRSGVLIDIPEVDRGAWFSLVEARRRILKTQEPFLHALGQKLLTTGPR